MQHGSSARRKAQSLLRRAPGLVALWLACNAPHDNPLDPSLGGNVEGRVLTRRATGIADAEVLVPAAGRIVRTDSTGSFGLYGLPEGSLELQLAADGYVAESVAMTLKRGRIDTLDAYLDGLPYLEDCRFTTHVQASWTTQPPFTRLVYCQFTATASDADGKTDLDSVWVEIPAIGYARRLDYDPYAQLFTQTLRAESLPDGSLETLMGQPVLFKVADQESAAVQAPPCYLSRIIDSLPAQVFPGGFQDTVSGDTTFVWNRFNYGCWVSYHCEIGRIINFEPAGVVAAFDQAGPQDTTYSYDPSGLASGDYYWTVEAIDEFGNSVRSAEEPFHVN
jgi:hypothetical protein